MNNTVKKREIIIISVLGFIFLAVLLGMLWDLYGSKYTLVEKEAQNNANSIISKESTGSQQLNIKQPKGTNNNNTNIPANKGTNKQTTDVSYTTYSQCLENTKDEGSCKDCCDCLGGDASVAKACRDACPTYDYSKNTEYKEFEISSKLGPNGDYSKCTASGNAQQCKQCCDEKNNFACGDTKYCRTACNNLGQ